MVPVDFDFMPPAVRADMVIPFDVAEWTSLNLIPGGGPAASAYTRGMHCGLGANPMETAYAIMRFCMAGEIAPPAAGHAKARLAAFRINGTFVYFPAVVPEVPGQKNVGVDVTTQINAEIFPVREYWQFMVQVKGKGILTMARLETVFKAGL